MLGLGGPSSQYSKEIKIKSINHFVENHRYGPPTVRTKKIYGEENVINAISRLHDHAKRKTEKRKGKEN